jgi:caffeoyl-CoA O-methyltransferase
VLGFILLIDCVNNKGDILVNRMAVFVVILSFIFLTLSLSMNPIEAQNQTASGEIDTQARQFLNSHRSSMRGMSVPDGDGQALYDIILKHGYKNALEIGTSIGRSGIWIAWALSKTGGKLVTIEIDRDRYEEALANDI